MRRNEGTRHTMYINPRSPAPTMTCPLTEHTDPATSPLTGISQLSLRTPGTPRPSSPMEYPISRANWREESRPITNTGSLSSIPTASPDDQRPSDFWELPDRFASPQGRRQQEIMSGRTQLALDQDLNLDDPLTEPTTRQIGMLLEQQRLLETLRQRTYLHRYR